MAYTDTITDGTDTVNLGSTATGTFNDRLSYKQQIPEKNALGDYPLVTEQWLVNWNDTSDDSRGGTHAKLLRLKRKAQKWANKDYREGPVWRVLRSSTENQNKYAVVTNIHIPELDPNTYGPETGFRITPITVTREGVWRTIQPGSTLRTLVSGTNVYNYNYHSATNYVNWVTITPGEGANELPGDADALLKISVTACMNSYFDRLVIAKRTADTLAELNGFIPYFNPADISYSSPTHSTSIDSLVAGGQRLDISNATGSEQTYTVAWDYDPEYYQGEFLMVVPIKMGSTSDYAWLAPIHNKIDTGMTSLVEGDEVYVPPYSYSPNFYRTIVIGPVSLPHTGMLPPSETFLYPYPADYLIGFTVRLPNGMSCQIRQWWLVPIDEGVQEIRNIKKYGESFDGLLTVDGVHRLAHTVIYPDPDPEYIMPRPLQPSGRYLTADHQKYTRLYFFEGYTDDTSSTGQGPTDAVFGGLRISANVFVQGVPRHSAFYSDDIY